MHARFLLLLSIVIFLVGCNADSTTQSKDSATTPKGNSDSLAPVLPADSTVYDSKEYAYISKIIQTGESVFIDADYIQFLIGQAAIDAAVKAHEADTFTTEDGVTHVGVSNDYYIVNENNRIRRLKLANNVKYELLLDMHAELRITNTLEGLKQVYKLSPYILILHKNEIVKIEEKFVP